MEKNAVLPFAMTNLDLVTNKTRGYKPQPNDWEYDPKSQTTNQLAAMGDTSPTTHSSISSTGLLNDDSDEGADDEGKD